jgi:hypothetical protein
MLNYLPPDLFFTARLKQRSIGAIGLLLAWNAWQKQNVNKLSLPLSKY